MGCVDNNGHIDGGLFIDGCSRGGVGLVFGDCLEVFGHNDKERGGRMVTSNRGRIIILYEGRSVKLHCLLIPVN